MFWDIPMDCDDNDISCNDLQLAGEGRSRSSSALSPYDFPKFDFDDSLQGHLKFDNLVETEVFLGIQSQEDNHWIEDFSRGSNGMEFNPTPADSCSISKRNNVWSEATSSESVEMLLKSVGQEEMMPEASNISETNASGDQGTLTEPIDSSSKSEDRNDGYVANSEAKLSRDETLRDYPAFEGHVEERLPEVEPCSLTPENVEPICGSSSDVAEDVVCGMVETSTNKGEHSYHDDCVLENLEASRTSVEMSMISVEGSVHVTRMVDCLDSNVRMLSTSEISEVNVSASLKYRNGDGQEKHVSTGAVQEEPKALEGKTTESGSRICTTDSSRCLVMESGVVNNKDAAIDPSLDCMRKCTNIPIKGAFELKPSEGDNNASLSTSKTGKHEIEVLAINNKMGDPVEGCQGWSAVDGIDPHFSELGGLGAEHCEEILPINKMEDIPASPFKSKSISEMPLSSMDDNKVPVESSYCVDDTDIGKSPEVAVEIMKTDCVERCDSVASREEVGAHLPSSVMGDLRQVTEENLGRIAADFSETKQDTSKSKEEVKIPTNTGIMDFENVGTLTTDQTTQSLDVGKGVKGNDAVHELQPQTSGIMDSGNDVASQAKTSVSPAINDQTENLLREPVLIGLSDNDRVKAATMIPSTVNLGTDVGVGVPDVASRSPLSEIVAKSPQSVDKCNDISSIKYPLVSTINSLYSDQSQVHSDQSQVQTDCDNSCLKESVNVDLVSGEHLEEEAIMKNEGEKESTQVAEVDKASCGSPTIISEMGKDNQQEGRDIEVADKFIEDDQSTSKDPKGKDASGDDTSFTFKVNTLPDTVREPGKSWSPFPNVEKCKSTVVVENTGSGKGKTETITPQKTTPQSVRVSDGDPIHGTSKSTSERKARRASTKGIAKEKAKKDNQGKGTNEESISVKGDKALNSVLSTSSGSPHVQFGQMNNANLPDLNTSTSNNNSASPSATFRQPFTDLQQVQLRAQIFVYGSLIQGTAPDEDYMVSAFGSSDGGRSIWEPVWRTAVERVRSQKSNSSAAETPLRLQSYGRASDRAMKQGSHSSKVPSSPVSRATSNCTTAAIVNPIIPMSSPLWSISTPSRDSLPSSGMHKSSIADYQHTITPLPSCQTPPVRNFVGHTSWPSQTCFPSPWLASPRTSNFNSSVCYQPVTMTEPVKLTPVKDSSGPPTYSPAVHTVGPSPKLVSSSEPISMDSKPRKRKKVPLPSEARIEQDVVANMTTILASPVDRPKISELDTRKDVTCSEETLRGVTEAKTQAEEAASLATTTINHSEELWSQLAKEKDSGLTSQVEAKLVSAAAAISAAASVAKAAAAAARLAFNAALQAKLMANEALLSSKTSGLITSSGKLYTDGHDIGNTTPSSILKGDNITNQSSLILSAAKEAAKRRVEAASFASKQAENLDAIVKAAELASLAVSQAGKIVALGEPLPLSDLIDGGQEGYWRKLPQSSDGLAEKMREKNREKTGAIGLEDGSGICAKVSVEDSVEKGGPRERSDDSFGFHVSQVDGIKGSTLADEKGIRSGEGCKASDAEKASLVVSEPESASRTGIVQNEPDGFVGTLPHDYIKEGSLVEVFKDRDGQKSAWYSAKVLSLEDGKAYVCYSDLLSEEGSGNLREWVSVEGEGDNAPIIRAAHPLTALQLQATRKRRRSALGDYAWCVGDKVDVWIDDCWREGMVTEKIEKDETTLKVHFQAQGETSTVRAWNLRKSRSWSDGKWVEWSSLRVHNATEQSDMPLEKRQKLGSPAIATKEKDNLSNDVDSALGKPEESNLLALSTKEKVFDIGKSVKDDDKRATRRPLRTGQQKEVSRVIFGVPKPNGKKRKFMEVSKHFPANKSDRSNESNDSVKFAKYLMPQATVSRGWKAPMRNDSKEKRLAQSKPRVPISRKPPPALPRKSNPNSTSSKDNDNIKDHGTIIENSVSHDENTSENLIDHGSSTSEEAPEAPLSSLLSQSLRASSKKIPSSNTKSGRLNKGKLAPSGGKLSKIEEDKVYASNSGKSDPEVGEPRRSNRRTQPTHRLLEGMQSSMIIPKMPSVSHEKAHKKQNKNVSTGGK